MADDLGEVLLVQGGRDRGLILHKLLEEVLTGECQESVEDLSRRAEDLIRQIGAQPTSAATEGLSPTELAQSVARALRVPEVAAVRNSLIPEVPVYGIEEREGDDCAIFGVADARRENEANMQGTCSKCHADAHRWAGRFPPDLPEGLPFRLDVPDWSRRP